MTGRPENDWIEILTGQTFTEAAERRGVLVEIGALAAALTDCGLIPKRDDLVQVYRALGYQDEHEWADATENALPMGTKHTASTTSLRALEEQTGIPKTTILRRRQRLDRSIASQYLADDPKVSHLRNNKPKGGKL